MSEDKWILTCNLKKQDKLEWWDGSDDVGLLEFKYVRLKYDETLGRYVEVKDVK